MNTYQRISYPSVLFYTSPLMVCRFILIALLFVACDLYDDTKLRIERPTLGSMIPADIPVEIRIVGQEESLGEVLVDGLPTAGIRRDGGDTLLIYREPSDGLGFVSAERADDPYLVVRSWLQGTFIPSSEWYPESITLSLGGPTLNDGEDSLAELLRLSLINVELKEYVSSITVDLSLTNAEIIIDSAMIKELSVRVIVDEEVASVEITIAPLEIAYHIESDLIRSRGVGFYDQVQVSALAQVTSTGITLVNPTVETSSLRLDDDYVPDSLINAIADALQDQFKETLLSAISDVTSAVTAQLFSQLRPSLGVNLPQPITQETRLTSARLARDSLVFTFDSKVAASVSQHATLYSGALLRPSPLPADRGEEARIFVGAGLVNQIAYAAWDAGNFHDLRYSRSELEALGLGKLEFPYSNFEYATVSLLLPPILEWGAGGPSLFVGGIYVDLKIDYSKDTQAWTAVQVPLRLTLEGGRVQVSSDPLRPLGVNPVMLNRLNKLAEREEVQKLIRIAIPSVVNDILSEVPLISVAPIQLRGLEGAPLITLTPLLREVSPQNDHWLIDLALRVSTQP